MKNRILLPALMVILSGPVLAQSNPIFFGGQGDGVASSSYMQLTNDVLINHGGIGDGTANAGYVQNVVNPFKGGFGDGYSLSTSGIPTTDKIFYGGLSDGYGLSSSGSPAVDKLFFGGLADGSSAATSGSPNADRIFFGGRGDGWSGGYFLSVPLPLELLSFSGTQAEDKHLLSWQIANQAEVAYFELERATAHSSFEKLGTVQVTHEQSYQYTDDKPIRGDNFYRLKLVARDGKCSWSNTVLLKLLKNNAMIRIYPNPAASTLYIALSGGAGNDEVLVDIYDAAAHLVKRSTLKKDNQAFSVDVQAWAAGIYSIRIIDGCEISVFKFVKP